MQEGQSIVINYDRSADVLYVALGQPVPAETDIDENGFFLRFALDSGAPCGITIPAFHRGHWDAEKSDVLEGAISFHLGIPAPSVSQALKAI